MANNFTPELLLPAGNFEKMKIALMYGADAVYLAGPTFGMRAAADNFTNSELREAIQYAHKMNKKVYVTVNTMPRQNEIASLEEYLQVLADVAPDAVIVADLGVFRLCKKIAPRIPIHISTQAATVNAESCRMWHELGAQRIVLARELSLDDIAEIKANIPKDLELEVFVHGSMCVSFSGRCMLSQYYTSRDANRGACTQPCRWEYEFHEIKRKDDNLTCEIHPEGSYIFGSKDLCMIGHLSELYQLGIQSLKIEGRMKSAYYAAVCANTYRIALNHGTNITDSLLNSLRHELDSVSHREYCTGYFFHKTMEESHLASNTGYVGEKTYLCTVVGNSDKNGICLCRQKNKFKVGDLCEYITPGNVGEEIKIIEMYDEKGTPIESCPHPQMLFSIRTNRQLKEGDIIRSK